VVSLDRRLIHPATLADNVSAAQPPHPGAPVTIDNVQLGMFVQRGRDWTDGDRDGGVGSVGIVTRLYSDGSYTEVTFPTRGVTPRATPMTCRIGALNKYELQVDRATSDKRLL
jgi:hypothetical protein